MIKLSANLGFLWTELALPDAIERAAAAGFEAVEFHWPYETQVGTLKAALDAAAIPLLGLNTRRGNVDEGEAGLTALPTRKSEARAHIDEAIDYGAALGSSVIHVMSGVASGDQAHETFVENLRYASNQAAKHSMGVVIEPINTRDIPGYFLNTVEQAAGVIQDVGSPNVKIMFDCYHVQIMQGDLVNRLHAHLPLIGHIQIAAVPDRGEPGQGELDYPQICRAIDAMGYNGYIGAEYKPRGTTDEGLGWIASIDRAPSA